MPRSISDMSVSVCEIYGLNPIMVNHIFVIAGSFFMYITSYLYPVVIVTATYNLGQ